MTATLPARATGTPAPARSRARAQFARTAPGWLAAVLAVLLAGVVPTVVVLAQPDATGRLVWIPAAAVMAWSGIRLAGIVASAAPPLFQFAFHTYVYAYFGLGPLVQLRAGQFPLTSPLVESENVITIWWLVGTGIAAYEVGVWLARRRIGRRAPPAGGPDAASGPPPGPGERGSAGTDAPWASISEGRTTLLAVVAVALSAGFIAVVGPHALFASREDVKNALDAHFSDSSQGALVLAIGFGPLLVAVHALLRVRRRNLALGVARRKTPLLVLAVVVLLVAVNPVSAARFTIGTVALSFVVLFGGLATAWRRRAVLLAVLVSFVVLLPSLALSRYAANDQYGGPAPKGLLDNVRRSGDWDSFASVGNAVHYVQDHGVAHGFQFLGSLTFWMPRSLWPGKPVDTGILLAQDRGYPMTNLSAPLWAEAYVNGGLVVVAVVFLLYGAVSVLASARTWRALRTGGPWAITGSIFAWYSFILLRGSLLQATGTAVLMLACTAFVLARRPAPSPRRSPRDQHRRAAGPRSRRRP